VLKKKGEAAKARKRALGFKSDVRSALRNFGINGGGEEKGKDKKNERNLGSFGQNQQNKKRTRISVNGMGSKGRLPPKKSEAGGEKTGNERSRKIANKKLSLIDIRNKGKRRGHEQRGRQS